MGGLRRAIFVVVCATSCTAVRPEVGDRLETCVDGDSDPAHDVDFKMQVRPIIEARCSSCHYYSRGTQDGYMAVHLDLETLATLKKGGTNTGAGIVIAKKPCSSAIVQKIRGTFPIGARMPRDGPPYLSREEIQLFMDWIAEGAKGNDSD